MAEDAEHRCSDCRAPLVAGQPFCVECGAPTGAPSTAPPAAASSGANPRRRPQGPSPLTPLAYPGGHQEGTGSEPVVPLPSTAQTQPVTADPGDQATHPGQGPVAVPPDESEEAPDFSPGEKVLSQYRVVRKLGSGGMGAVYLARDDLTGQQVAVKVLPAVLAREKGIRERFTLEARALASLDHPNIVPLINYAQDGDDRFLVMKYVEGTPLDVLLEREGKLPLERAEQIFRALVEALGYAHDNGVIHRDVKPANVLIAHDGRIYLVDFGIAKKAKSVKLTQTGMLMGTPQYMSPELISGMPIDGRNDLYSAGLLLFEMLCGQPPFIGERTFTVLRAHVEAPVPDPVALRGEPIPARLLHTIDRLLQKAPEERPATAADALALLDDEKAPSPSFAGKASSASVAASTTPVTVAVDADEVDDELSAAFSRQQTWSVAAFSVGTLALVAAVVGLVLLWPKETPARGGAQADAHAAERAETNVVVKLADKKLKEKKPVAALEILKGVPEVMRNRADVVSLEAEAHLDLEHIRQAEALVKSLSGNEARLPPEVKARLTEQRDRLKKLKGARRRAAAAEARRRSKLPHALTNQQILDVTHGPRSSEQLRLCWEETVLKKAPQARGHIKLEVRITRGGDVERVKVLERTVGDERFERCVEKTADRWRFPEVKGPPTDVVQLFRFEPKEG